MRKKLIIIITAILLIIVLFPFSDCYRDGGTRWVAPVTNIYRAEILHRLHGDNTVTVGTVVYILGFEVYNDSHISYE